MDLLFPEALSTGVGLFLLAASAVTSMLTAVPCWAPVVVYCCWC